MNKLSAVTLEGGLHVWDCSTLSQEGKFAQVRQIGLEIFVTKDLKIY